DRVGSDGIDGRDGRPDVPAPGSRDEQKAPHRAGRPGLPGGAAPNPRILGRPRSLQRRALGRPRSVSLRRGAVLSLRALGAVGFRAAAVGGRLDEVRRAGESVSWGWACAALACALASHAMVGLALSETLAVLGHALGGPTVLGIALVSTTANYLVS